MQNPYTARGPLQNEAMFFGRSQELNELAAFIQGNQSVSIVGPRKIGKTSLFFHLMRPAFLQRISDGDNVLFTYLDCEVLGNSTHTEIFSQFAAEIEATLTDQERPSVPALTRAIAQPTRLSFETALRQLNRKGLRIVLILDEFEKLSVNPNLNVNFFNALRSAAGRYQLIFLTASAAPLIQLTYSEHSQDILSSPFFNIFAQLPLGLFAQTEALQLISQPADGAERPFNEELTQFIYTLAGRHPFYLQVACYHAFALGNSPIEIEARVRDALEGHFEYYWRNLHQAEQEALQNLDGVSSRTITNTTMAGILRNLVRKCLLIRESGVYRFPARAWEQFVGERPFAQAPILSQQGRFSGTDIAPYRVETLLGQGGMAEVYKGRHIRLGRDVAIKILPAALATEPDFRLRFEREAQTIASFRHENIVQVYDFGEIQGSFFMVMEYVDGLTLSEYLQQKGKLSLAQTVPIIEELAAAIDYAHGLGIIHRDVKPSNILLRKVDATVSARLPFQTVLTDFGIAKISTSQPSTARTGGMLGTIDYIAPEQIQRTATVGKTADIYSLGVVIFRLLTGELPYKGDNPGAILIGHLQAPPPNPRLIDETIPTPVAQAIMQAMAKEPAARFQSASALADALRGAPLTTD